MVCGQIVAVAVVVVVTVAKSVVVRSMTVVVIVAKKTFLASFLSFKMRDNDKNYLDSSKQFKWGDYVLLTCGRYHRRRG